MNRAFEDSIDDYLDFCEERGESPDQRSQMELSPPGIHWPEIDEDLTIAGWLREHVKHYPGGDGKPDPVTS